MGKKNPVHHDKSRFPKDAKRIWVGKERRWLWRGNTYISKNDLLQRSGLIGKITPQVEVEVVDENSGTDS